MRNAVLPIAIVLVARIASGAPVAAPGYAIHTIATPDSVQGGVVRRGDAIFVGQGSFGVGMQRIVRVNGDQAVTIATGFNSLGGFAFAPDGRLYVVDNGGGLDGAL